MLCIGLCHFYFCNHIGGEERAGCFTLFDFLVSSDCYVALPHCAVGWSAECDCGISSFFYSWAMSLKHPSFGFARVKGSTQSAELARLARILKC